MCEGLLNGLLDRLGNRSMSVKMKAMRCIKHLVKQGSPHFRTLLQGRAEQLRPCIAISGAPDPRFGDSLYAAIRADATEVLDLLYRPAAVRQQQTLASRAAASVASAPAPYATPADGLSAAAPAPAGTSFQARFQREGGGGGGTLTNFGAVPGGQAPYTRSAPDERPPVQPTAAQSSLARDIFGTSSSGDSNSSGGDAEARLARLLDAARGASVPAAELHAYTQQLRAEGAAAVGAAVRTLDGAARTAASPAAQMRVLSAVQAVCDAGAAGAQEHAGPLLATLGAWRASPVFAVRNKAQAVAALLRSSTTTVSPSSASAAAPAPASAPLADLLGLGNAPAPVLAPQQQAAADPLADLLFGGSAPQPQPQPQTASTGSLDALLGLGTQSAPAPAPAPAPAQSSFDFLSSPAPAPAPAQAPPAAADLFSGLSTSDDHSTAPSSFDFVAGAPAAATTATTSTAEAQPSAFDFLSSVPAPAPAEPPTAFAFVQSDPAPAAPSSSAFSFTAAPAANASGNLLDL